ncbi:MAG: hypothetical protein WD341_20165 [Tistlia sp.]|uniref:hypothetical protein n=1 Tax=Tistlia sp. TaxID=3057121 RepID=UPI0034A46772
MAGFKRRALEEEDRSRKAIGLGELAAEGIGVFCWCNRCGHNATLGIERLVQELGPGFPVPELGGRLRCSGCGAKDVATRPGWPSVGPVARHGPDRS